MKDEQFYIETLNDFQKKVLRSLKKLGFKWIYFTCYSNDGYSNIDVSSIKSIDDVILHFFNDGKDQKRFELINCLGL